MYFASRMQAGRMLAAQLKEKYRYENCAIVALDDGGVVIGAQIAIELHCVLMQLSSADINLPREVEAIGAIAQDGSFTYNQNYYSTGEIEELKGEYFSLIEQEKMEGRHELIGEGGSMRKDLLRGHNIILVSDGLKDGFDLDVAFQYLKPVAIEKIIVATPLASVSAVDHMHIMADDICCLSVIENYMDTDHYYDTQDVPEHDKIIEIIEKIVLNWK